MNGHDVLSVEKDPTEAVYASGEDALRLGCVGVGYIAAELGADIVKVKLSSARIEQAQAKPMYERHNIASATLAERVRHIVQSRTSKVHSVQRLRPTLLERARAVQMCCAMTSL